MISDSVGTARMICRSDILPHKVMFHDVRVEECTELLTNACLKSEQIVANLNWYKVVKIEVQILEPL